MQSLVKLLMSAAKRPWAAAGLVCLVLLSLLSLVLLSRRVSVQLPLDLSTPQVLLSSKVSVQLPLDLSALLQFTAAQPSGQFGPDFAACDRPGHCGPDSLRSNYKLECLKLAHRTAQRIGDRARPPVIVQIGVAGFSTPTLFTDVDLFSKALAQLSPLLRAAVRLVFVEPNQHYHQDMEVNIAKLGLSPGQVQIIHAMVLDTCERPKIEMYRFSAQAERDFGVPFGTYSSWLGTVKTLPLAALRGYASSAGLDTPQRDRWLSFSRAPNRSEYVEKIEIPCLTPAKLLSTAQAVASDVAMMVIDAEGSDFRIVDGLLQFEDFAPGYFQWECPGTVWFDSNPLKRVVLKLRDRGYKVGGTYGHGRGDSDEDNCIAVHLG